MGRPEQEVGSTLCNGSHRYIYHDPDPKWCDDDDEIWMIDALSGGKTQHMRMDLINLFAPMT